MFLGTFEHNIDDRNRLMLPKKFRGEVGRQAVVTRGLDGCLFLYPVSSWKKIEEKLVNTPLTSKDARSFARHMLSGAMEVEVDKFGRVLLPSYLKEFGGVKESVMILGLGERAEIWDKKRWKEYSEKLDGKSDQVAERLTELGI